MAKLDLGSLSLKELLELQRDLPAAISEKQKAQRAALKAKMTALAEAAGLTLDDVVGNARKRGNGAPAAVKYRDPSNAENTWSGRGRMATWLKDKLAKRGAKLEDFAV